MIEVRDLQKSYGDLIAVDRISFRGKAGSIFGLLGPNGAGKSTCISCLSGLLKPTAGSVRVGGFDMSTEAIKAKSSLGIVPQELAIYEDLSARDNLAFWGAAYGLKGDKLQQRVGHVLNRIGLADRASDLPKTYSGGMKRRLNFGCGLVHEPAILLLDEPTVGVDPQSREHLFELVREEKAKGTCVLYTTHYMEEAEKLCDELAIIDHGKIIATGTLEALRAEFGGNDIIQLSGSFDQPKVEQAVTELHGEVLALATDTLMIAIRDGARSLPSVLQSISATGAEIHHARLSEPNLESLFLKLTGKDLRA
ncbi:MAG: ATP-binding cassette domain-containing protein [Gammaproteobacteria bacterium]|nr:ATP-binding cassette domain-containing protein [Gammaproteobacteria bacterium]MBT8076353.1 ATP-binding cassette domain-containing protein [Gammaproteobacteria bacterium]NNK97817.1 ATP-binding cassette domain-containing protein [Xanthomonadales bacterium]